MGLQNIACKTFNEREKAFRSHWMLHLTNLISSQDVNVAPSATRFHLFSRLRFIIFCCYLYPVEKEKKCENINQQLFNDYKV